MKTNGGTRLPADTKIAWRNDNGMKFSTVVECQQHAGNIEHSDNEKRIGELADEEVSAADLEIVFASTEVSIADKTVYTSAHK